jgi:hypothetical protein
MNDQPLSPEQAAKFLGISVALLAKKRREGRVQGMQIGSSNLYVYSVVDLSNADLSEKKRGPKPKNTNAERQASG